MIYFDNAANHYIEKEDVELLAELMLKYPANIESRHAMGLSAKVALNDNANEIIKSLNLTNHNLLYFSSGTEIFNFICYIFKELKNKNIVTSKLEHPALLQNLISTNLEVRYINIDKSHQFDIENAKKIIDKDTALVALNLVQSETGVIQNLDNIINLIRTISPSAFILVDSIQGVCKLDLPYGADFYTISNHKICGLYGAGLVYRKNINLDMQQLYKNYRHKYYLSSRVETASILVMGKKMTKLANNIQSNFEKVNYLNKYLREQLSSKLSDTIQFLFSEKECSPYILNIILPSYDGAIIAGLLSEKEIMVSSSSACMSESKEPSLALKAFGIPNKNLFNSIRVSLSENNTIDELNIFIDTLIKILKNY